MKSRRSSSHRSRRPSLEALERRDVPATWGIAWPDAQHLTLSFVPDGTAVEGQSSQLFGTLNSQLGTSNWEATILAAYQTWAENSNINIGLVADGGEPIGAAGAVEGDPRFGDIRVSAIPLPAGVEAITSPYDPATGTFSGDMILNSNDNFNSSTGYDLFTVALHEAGHVFGFADSSNPSSFMYNVYTGPQTSLSSAAISALQSMYGGPRNIAAADVESISTDPTKPVDVTSLLTSTTGSTVGGDLGSTSTATYYQFTAPSTVSAALGVDLQVQTGGLSQLIPRITVTDSNGNIVSSTTATTSSGSASIHLSNLVAGQVYKIRVDGPTNDLDAIGSYALSLSPTTLYTNAGSNFSGATSLAASNPTATGQITGTKQANYYSFTTPPTQLNGATIQLQDFGIGLVAPQVTIYNAAGTVVGQSSATTSSNPTAKVNFSTGLTPKTTYYIQVTNGIVNAYNFGIYQVSIAYGASTAATSAPIMQTPWLGSIAVKSPPPNTSLTTAVNLQTPAGYAQGTFYAAMAGNTGNGTAQYYSIKAPASAQGGYMIVNVQTLASGTFSPVITVYDKSGNQLAAQVLTESGGVAVVQVPCTFGTQAIIKVAGSAAAGGNTSGNYLMTAMFQNIASSLTTLTSGTLASTAAGATVAGTSTSLTVPYSEVYKFVLQGDPRNTGTDAMLRLTVTDSSGDVLTTLTCLATEAADVSLVLGPGTYSIYVDAYSPSQQAIPPLYFYLDGTNLTDPIRASPASGGGSSGTTY